MSGRRGATSNTYPEGAASCRFCGYELLCARRCPAYAREHSVARAHWDQGHADGMARRLREPNRSDAYCLGYDMAERALQSREERAKFLRYAYDKILINGVDVTHRATVVGSGTGRVIKPGEAITPEDGDLRIEVPGWVEGSGSPELGLVGYID